MLVLRQVIFQGSRKNDSLNCATFNDLLRKLLNQLLSSDRVPAPNIGTAASARENADRFIALGDRAETEGNLREACEQYRKAVDTAPGYAKARLHLGVALEALGEAEGAIASYEAAVAIDPASAYASYNLGRLLFTSGALPRAEELLHSALRHKPEFPEAHVVLSSVHEAQGNLDTAVVDLEAALAQRPDWVGALFNYGIVLKKLDRLSEAESALSRVIAIDAGNADAGYELANLLYARGALPEAEKHLRLALEHKPEFPEAQVALSDVYESQGKLNAAVAALEIALRQRPDWVVALNNYGAVLRKLQRLAEAEAVLRRALVVAPEFSPAYGSLGSVLLNQCRIAEALKTFRMGRESDPERFELESAELFALGYSDDISSEALFARHRAFGLRLEKAYPPRFEPFQNVRDPERRLRIGYVSGDFCNHAVALFTIPLIERHHRSAYEIYCYSVGTIVDEFTRQVQTRADVWREAAGMSPAELADTINRDGIDILVDLSGHSGESRLSVFAQQPAPVQVTWLGYLCTTGTTRIQYRLCDCYTDPPELDHLHTETLIRLPKSQWCYRARASVDYSCSGIAPFRKNGFITFGSFNHIPKLSQSARRLWAEILAQLPDSRLILVGVPEGRARDSLIQDFESAGIAETRIRTVPRIGIQEYFDWFNAVDIALDTTPYSGGTTTCDALWMGVPVITVPGSRPASRSAAGILSTVGLTEWIASTPEDYVRRAVGFARDGALLSGLRETLRQRMLESPLMDEVCFAADIEQAYRQMWRTWCSGASWLR